MKQRWKDGRVERRTLVPARRWAAGVAVSLSVLPAFPPFAAAQCPDGAPPPCRAATRPVSVPAPNSVAVLYFDNLSRDSADAYLADGLSEDVITRLGQVERLVVKSRSAVQRLRGAAAGDPGALGQALGVAHLVTGSVRRVGSGLRVTVELVRATSGVHVWGDQYDRRDADVLAIEDDIARQVATAIAGRLAPPERQALTRHPSGSAEAYDHFLRGNYYLAQRALTQAITQYESAARLDPQFADALARSALGYALSLDWDLYPGVPPDSLLGRGEAAAARALQLNPRSSDAWMTRGYLLTFHNPLTYDGVAEALRQAIAIDPRNAEAYHFRGVIRAELGEDSAAAEAAHQALAIDPLRAITLNALGRVEMIAHRYDAALGWLDSALAADPGFGLARAFRLRVRLLQGDTAQARRDAQGLAGMGVTDFGLTASALALMEARTGDTVAARARLNQELRATAAGAMGYRRASWLAIGLVAAGEAERALDLLGGLRRSRRLWYALRFPEFDAVRRNPRFQRLVEESRPMGAPR